MMKAWLELLKRSGQTNIAVSNIISFQNRSAHLPNKKINKTALLAVHINLHNDELWIDTVEGSKEIQGKKLVDNIRLPIC